LKNALISGLFPLSENDNHSAQQKLKSRTDKVCITNQKLDQFDLVYWVYG